MTHANLAGLCYDEVMDTNEVTIGSRWYVWGEHREVVEMGKKDGFPAVRLRVAKERTPERFMVLTSSLVKHGIPTDSSVSRYTEEDDRATSPAQAGADRSTDSTGKKVNATMTTATKQKRQAKAQERAAKPKPAAKPNGDKLAADLFNQAKAAATGTKLSKSTGTSKRDLTNIKVTSGDAVLAHLDVYPHRVRVFIRENGQYARFTVAKAEDIPTAAAAIAAKAAS